jgi:hypothetical protein
MTQLAYVLPPWLDLCDHSITLHTFLSVPYTRIAVLCVCRPYLCLYAEIFRLSNLRHRAEAVATYAAGAAGTKCLGPRALGGVWGQQHLQHCVVLSTVVQFAG